MEPLQRLGDRLDVIETALHVALSEPEPEHRGRMLDALDLAAAAVRAEHTEVETADEAAEEKRSTFRLIRGSGCSACHEQREGQETDAPAARSTDQTQARARTSAR